MSLADETYLKVVRDVLCTGEEKPDRTGTGTFSLHNQVMKFSLRREFPLLTTKRVFWRGVVAELLWFLSGSRDERELNAQGVRIWKEWAPESGDLGPVYGTSWRDFGGPTNGGCAERGVDQIANVIASLRDDPHSRRHIISTWNPTSVHEAALPPCHGLTIQFLVRGGRFLDCAMFQRSGDLGLGVPFNIASYALLVHIIAREVSLEPGELTMLIGDAHVYLDHAKALIHQQTLEARPGPRLRIEPRMSDPSSRLYPLPAYRVEDFVLEGYDPHPPIKMDVSV